MGSTAAANFGPMATLNEWRMGGRCGWRNAGEALGLAVYIRLRPSLRSIYLLLLDQKIARPKLGTWRIPIEICIGTTQYDIAGSHVATSFSSDLSFTGKTSATLFGSLIWTRASSREEASFYNPILSRWNAG